MSTSHRPTQWLLAAVIIGTVAADPFGFAPFGPIKWVIVTTAAFGALWLAMAAKLQVHRPSLWAWLGFLTWGSVVSVLAVDPVHTWIGTPDRRLGLVPVAAFMAAYLAAQTLRNGDVATVSRSFVIGIWIMVVTAALEAAGAFSAPFDFPGTRLGGSFGTPAYLGAALILFIPIVFAVGPSLETRAWQIAARWGAIGGLVVLLSTQTRGALVGATAAAGITYPAWSRWARANRTPLAALVVIFVMIASFTNLGSRLVDATDFVDGAAAGRLAEWSTGIDAIGTSPIYGVGFEGYRVVFPHVVTVDYVRAYGREFATDRAHNGLIDVTIWSGLVGGAFYLAAVGFLLRRAWQASRLGDPWLVGVAGAVAGYLVQQQFLFPVAEIDPAFWVTAGVLVVHTQPAMPSQALPRLGRYVALLLAAGVATFGVTDLAADHLVNRATIEDLSDYEAAVSLRPESIRYQLLAANAFQPADLDQAIRHIDQAHAISPGDPIIAIRRGELISARAALTGGADDVAVALATWRKLATTDANHPTVQLALGVAEIAAGNEAAAEAAWERAEVLAPWSPEPSHNLAILYRSQGRDAEAEVAQRRSDDLRDLAEK